MFGPMSSDSKYPPARFSFEMCEIDWTDRTLERMESPVCLRNQDGAQRMMLTMEAFSQCYQSGTR